MSSTSRKTPLWERFVTPNPFAPPRSEVADVVRGEASPSLWNPNAAARWSLLLTPAFGAFLHMKNWQALGEPGKAATSKTWLIVILFLFLVLGLALLSGFMPEVKALDRLSSWASIALLLTWYFSSARSQVAFVAGRFGTNYPRRGWLKPISLALLAFVGVLAVVWAVFLVAAPGP